MSVLHSIQWCYTDVSLRGAAEGRCERRPPQCWAAERTVSNDRSKLATLKCHLSFLVCVLWVARVEPLVRCQWRWLVVWTLPGGPAPLQPGHWARKSERKSAYRPDHDWLSIQELERPSGHCFGIWFEILFEAKVTGFCNAKAVGLHDWPRSYQ